SYCGVLQSTDGGVTWSTFNSGLATGVRSQAYALAIEGATVSPGFSSAIMTRHLAARSDPTTPTRIYVGTQGGGFISPSLAAVLGVLSVDRSGVAASTTTSTTASTTSTSTSTTTSTTFAPLCGTSPVAAGSCRLAAPLASQVQI